MSRQTSTDSSQPPIVPQEPVDLTAQSVWEYRAVLPRREMPWRPSLAEALEGLTPPWQHIPWPTEWAAFGVVEDRWLAGEGPPASALGEIPAQLEVAGQMLRREMVRARPSGEVELTSVFGAPKNGRTAFLFAELDVTEDMRATVHAGADYWMQWWLDGREVFSTMKTGNRFAVLDRAWPFEIDLVAGRHILCVRVVSGAGGWALASEAARRLDGRGIPSRLKVQARLSFDVAEPSSLASLTFVGATEGRPLLNGRRIPLPVAGMKYRRVPAVPVKMLSAGPNALVRHWTVAESLAGARMAHVRHFRRSGDDSKLSVCGKLLGLPAGAASIQTGPILTMVGSDFITLTCRTNMPWRVGLRLGGRQLISRRGLIHKFVVRRLAAGREYPYTVLPVGLDVPRRTRGGVARTLPASGPVSFVFLSDCGPLPDVWARVGPAALARRPMLAVFGGDTVSWGCLDDEWDEDFFGKAPDFFANVPYYPILGNHDERTPLWPRIFSTPGGLNWAQRLGDVLLVGLDGQADWSAGGQAMPWLRSVLTAGADAAFIFAMNHYPAWASANHGRVGDDGQPVEPPVRVMRNIIYPVLVEHGVTAIFAGHDHCYERSELPGGVTAFSSGGAGAYLYNKQRSDSQNPYSQVFVSTHHFCHVVAEGDACTLTALTPDGQELDRRVWQRRRR
jgi:hypothetical protein